MVQYREVSCPFLVRTEGFAVEYRILFGFEFGFVCLESYVFEIAGL